MTKSLLSPTQAGACMSRVSCGHGSEHVWVQMGADLSSWSSHSQTPQRVSTMAQQMGASTLGAPWVSCTKLWLCTLLW